MGNLFELDRPAPDHDEAFEELVAALAVGSLEAGEAADLRPHLAACPRCRRLVGEYAAVVASLPLSVPEAPPNPGLKARLLAVVEAESGAQPSAVGPGGRAEPSRAVAGWRALGRWRLALAGPLAAALLLAAGLGWWALGLQAELRAQQARLAQQERFIAAIAAGDQRAALTGTDRAPNARGELVRPADGGPPLLAVQDLPALPPGQVYQIWVIAGGQPVSAGLLPPTDGPSAIAPLEQSLSGVQTVALTPEPAGGSSAPTGPIVLAGRL